MNGTIESDVLDYLADGIFKRIGKTPSLTEWIQERDRLEWDLRMNALSRIMGKQEPAYWAGPQCMSMSDMSTLFEQVIKQEAEKDRADFVYWSKISRWTLEEATALSFGKAPEFVNWDKVKAYHGQSSFADDYSKRRSLLLRAQEAEELPVPFHPQNLLVGLSRPALPYRKIWWMRSERARGGLRTGEASPRSGTNCERK